MRKKGAELRETDSKLEKHKKANSRYTYILYMFKPEDSNLEKKKRSFFSLRKKKRDE